MNTRAKKNDSREVVDIRALASWMDRDVEWLRHVVEYNFGCGCDFGYEEEEHCAIWQSLQAVRLAQQNLEAAQLAHQRGGPGADAMEKSSSRVADATTIGKQDL